MSRAFVKESDDDLAAGELPERPLPPHVNYVTTRGLEDLQARVRELGVQHERLKRESEEDSAARQKLREVERDLRYFHSQLERATPVDTANQPREEVHFGAIVKIEDDEGVKQEFAIVGDDEADVGRQDQLGFPARAGAARRENRRYHRLAPAGGRGRSTHRRHPLSLKRANPSRRLEL